jgi:dipeptidyl aminopeptidase/acylaminoacyl peptidase
MRLGRLFFVALMLFNGVDIVRAERNLTVEDILSMRTIQSPMISPDGSRIVFVVNEPLDEEHSKDPPNTDLWITSTGGGDPRRVTANPDRDFSPQWSPNGNSIAFLSVRKGTRGAQIFSLDPQQNTLRQLTRHGTSISSFAWAPNGRQIAFLATEPPDAALQERLRRGDDEISLDSFDTDQNAPRQKVWILDLISGKTHLVPAGDFHVTNIVWSPDGSKFLLTITDHANLDYEWTRSRLEVVPVSGGMPSLLCSTRGKLASPLWLPDGKGISFMGASANGTEQAPGSLFVCRATGSRPLDLTEGRLFTVQSYQWLPDGKSAVLAVLEHNTRYLALLDVQSKQLKRLPSAPGVVSSDFSLARGGRRVACIFETSKTPPDVWTGAPGEPLRQVTHLNPAFERLRYGGTEEVDWKARDGWDITGILVKPVEYHKGNRYPMIVQVHGGPESADLDGFQITWAQLFSASGYAVFLPNYRGSIGRGVQYTIANHGDRGGKDFLDILDGVDALVSRGIADPKRLGIGGWSYGGFMSSWAVTQTTRFKASVVGDGITDWFSLMGMAPVPMWNAEVHFLVWPYDDPEAYWRFSPVLQVKKVKTPTLMLWGELDPLIPPAQAREFFRGLRHYDIPSELIVYPREGHGLLERLHRKDAYQRILNWYDHYVKAAAN